MPILGVSPSRRPGEAYYLIASQTSCPVAHTWELNFREAYYLIASQASCPDAHTWDLAFMDAW